MRMRCWISCSLVILGCVFGATSSRAADTAVLRAGVARIDITPDKPVTMSGYDSRKGLSTGVHDPLSARVLAFEVGGRRLVLVSTDLIGFYSGTTDYVREALLSEFDLEPSELFLSAIHTHAGPALTISRERGHANNLEYTETLKGKLMEVVRQALDRMEPATVGLGIGHCPVGANRRELRISNAGEPTIVLGRNPYGPTDKEVLVMKVARPDGRLKAVAFDYATHATCLSGKNFTISGDVLGLAEQTAERVLGPDVIVPAFAGASGNINPWFRGLQGFDPDPNWVPEPVLLGAFLGQEVVHVCRGIRETASAGTISTTLATLQLPAKPDETPSGQSELRAVPFTITAARLGDVAFIGLGGEVLTEIGMAIKAGSPCRHTFVITHCNGTSGYLAPKELYVAGGYEIKSTPFAPQAAEIVVRESIRMLHDL